MESIPDHDNGDNSDPEKHGVKLVEGCVEIALGLWLVAFGNKMVNSNVYEDPASQSHGDGVYPVGHGALSGGVDGNANADPDGARDGEGERVGGRH